MINDSTIKLTPRGVIEKLNTLFSTLYDSFPTGPYIVALTAPAMSGKSETVAGFLQSLITREIASGRHYPEGYHWKALRTHDRHHTTLALARAHPRPIERKPEFYWFATGADCPPGETPGGRGLADNPWSVLAKQLTDPAVYRQAPRLVRAKERLAEARKDMVKLAAYAGGQAVKAGISSVYTSLTGITTPPEITEHATEAISGFTKILWDSTRKTRINELNDLLASISSIVGGKTLDLLRLYSDNNVGKPTLLILEDLDQWNTAVSGVLFSHFKPGDYQRLLVVVTLRQGSIGTERFFDEIRHSGQAEWRRTIKLELIPPETDELFDTLRKEIGEYLPRDALEYLHGQSGQGSPVMMREMVQSLHGWYGGESFFIDNSGSYHKDHSLASLRAHLSDQTEASASFRDLSSRVFSFALDGLDYEGKILFAAAAFVGIEFPRQFLVRVLTAVRATAPSSIAPTSTIEERLDTLLGTSPLIVPGPHPRFKGRFPRLAVLRAAEELIAANRRHFFDLYIDHVLQRDVEHGTNDMNRNAALAKVVLALSDRQRDLGSTESVRLSPPHDGNSALLSELATVTAKSHPDTSTSFEYMVRANEVLSGAAGHWFANTASSRVEGEANSNLWALHETLIQADPAGDFALARADAGVLRLQVWMNMVSATTDQRRRRIELAKRESKAARDNYALSKHRGNWRLKLRAIELDLLTAEAMLLHYKHSGKHGKQRIADTGGEHHVRSVLDLISKAITALGQTVVKKAGLAERIKEASLLEDPVARAELVNQLLAGLAPDDDASRDWPDVADQDVKYLRFRAMERLVLLSQWFAPEELRGLDISIYRDELIDSLRLEIAKNASKPNAPILLWALRRLGRLLLDLSNLWDGNAEETSVRTKALNYAREAVQRLKEGQRLEPGPKVTIELIRAVERFSQISDHGKVLGELRVLLQEVGGRLPPSDRRSYLLSELARVDRALFLKGSGRAPDWTPTLWQRFVQRDENVLFLDAVCAEFGNLLRPHDRRAVVGELFDFSEIGEVEVLNRLVASVKDRPFSVQDATVDILEGFSEGALAKGVVPDAAQPERNQLLAAIQDADEALKGSSARTRLAVVSLHARLGSNATLPTIENDESADAIDVALETLWRTLHPMRILADALYDLPAQRALADILKLISEALLSRAAREKQRRKLHFFLRDKAKFWFEKLEERLGDMTTLEQRQDVWTSQVKFHREYGNLYDATMFANKILRLQRYMRLGSELGGLLYQSNSALMSRAKRYPFRDTRQLLEIVVKLEATNSPHVPASNDVRDDIYRLRERLGAVLWQNVRARQPRETKRAIPLLPTVEALDKFASSENGAKGLIEDILELWASSPPAVLAPATMVVAKVAELHSTGIIMEDTLQRRYLIRDTFLPTSFYHFLVGSVVGLSGSALRRELASAGLPASIAVNLLGEKEHRRYERDFGSTAPHPMVTARGKIYVETVLSCVLPMAQMRVVVGASNSAVAMFMPKPDLDLLGLSNGTFQRQLANRLLNVRRFTGVPMVSLPKKTLLGLDAHAKLKQELTDFAGVFWSDLSFVSFDEENCRAIFELSIGAPVDPRKERTVRSMLAKAFPKISRLTIIGGFEDDVPENQDEGDDDENVDHDIDHLLGPARDEVLE